MPTVEKQGRLQKFINVQWQYMTTPLETGNSIITEYELQQEIFWPDARAKTTPAGTPGMVPVAGQNFKTVQTGNNNYFVIWQTEQGPEYRYRVRAKNIYGWGVYSDTLVVPTGTVPDTPAKMLVINPPTSAIDKTPNVKEI